MILLLLLTIIFSISVIIYSILYTAENPEKIGKTMNKINEFADKFSKKDVVNYASDIEDMGFREV